MSAMRYLALILCLAACSESRGFSDARPSGDTASVDVATDDVIEASAPDVTDEGMYVDAAVDTPSADAPNTCDAGSMRVCDNQCVDTSSDPTHCGSCSGVCPSFPREIPTCVGGRCPVVCESGWGDCNGTSNDGCEANVATDDRNCGACGHVCSFPQAATLRCDAGACELLTCSTGSGNCDGVALNGCEINLTNDSHNCGACGHDCAGRSCVSGACR